MSSFPSLVATKSASSRRNSTPHTAVLIGQTSALDEATGSNGLTAKRLPRSVSPYTSRVGSHQSDAAMETLEPLDFSNSIHTTVSASLLGECEGQTESRSIVVTSDCVWCAEKESIVIRSLDDASTVHIIHKTPYMGFIWVLENVYHTVWVGCSDGHIRVLNQTSYKELQDLHAHSSGIYAMLHSGPYVFSGSADFYVLQWSAETCELIRKIDLSSGGIRCLCTVNAQIACGSDDGKIRLLETHSGACLQQWDAHSAGIRCVLRIGETSRFWSAGEDGLIKVWDATTGEELQALTGHGGHVTSMLYFCGSVWSGGVDGTIIVWDSISGSLIHRMVHHKGYITCLARIQRSDMGIIWTAGSDKALKRWSCLCTPKSEFEDEALPNEDLQHHLSLECERNQVLNTENAALRSEIVALKSKLQTTQCTTTVPHSAPSSEPGKEKARRVTNHVQGRTGLVDELQFKLHEKEHRIRQLEKEKLTEKGRTNELQLTLTRLQEYVDLMHEQNKSKQLEAGSRNAQTGQNALQDLLKEREQELEKAKKELDVSRLGQDYNMKMILELQHRVDILERSSAQLQKEISTRDEIICDLRKSVFPTNPSHTGRQRDPPDPVINTLNLSTDEPKRMSFNTVETIAQQLQKQIDELMEASNRLHEDTLESYEKLRSCRSRSSGSLDSTMEHNASSNFVYNMQVIYVLLQRTQSDISQLVDNLKDLRTASPGRLSGPSRGPSHTVSPTHSQRVGVNPSVPPSIRKLSNGGNVYLPGNSESEVRSFSNVENSVPASPQSALSTTNHSSSFNVQSAVASSMKEEPQKTTEDPQSGRLVHLISNQPSTLSGSMSNRAAVSARLRASRAMTPTKTMTRPTNTVNPNLLLRRRMSPVCAKLRPDGSRCTSPTYTGFARKGISGSQSTLKLS